MYSPTYPYPVAYPMPYQPRTVKGIGWIVRAFMLYIAVAIIGLLFSIFAFTLVNALLAGDQNAVPMLLLLALSGLITGILALVVIIFFFIGYSDVYKGRNEFGPTHARNVQISLYTLLAAIIVTIVGGVVAAIVSFTAFTFDPWGGLPTFNPDAIVLSAVISIAFGIVGAAFVAATLVLPARELVRPEHRTYLYLAAAIGTAGPGLSGAITLMQIPGILRQGVTGGTPFVDTAAGLPSVVSGLIGIVLTIIYLICYRGAETRLKSGELQPVTPPPEAGWMAAPVVPPYTWGPPPPPPPAAGPPPPG